MKLIKYAFMSSALLMSLTACNDDNPWQYSSEEGGIVPRVNTDCKVSDAIPTRATAFAPETGEFGLRLSKTDGSFTKTWETLAAFPEDEGFRSGEYILEAFYGAEDVEGFNKPYYHGQTLVNVKPGEATEASVTASLANTMVSVEYTDAFKNYFASYNTSLHSEGYGHHTIPADVTDALYLHPGKITVTVDFTKQNGQSATIQPAEFTAEARHFYHLTLDVNGGEVGDAQLVIRFDDTVQTEDVLVDLSDELLNVPAPEVSADGFTPGETLQILEQTVPDAATRFNVFAPGGITSAVLTIESDTYTPAFGREIDLANLSPSLQAQVEAAGIRVLGLYKNPDKMATVNISGLMAALPTGTHRVTLVVKDRLTRVNDPVTFAAECSPLELSFVRGNETANSATTGTIILAYNGTDLAKNVTVEGLNDNGVWVSCPITAATAVSQKRSRSAAFPVKNYNVTLTVPPASRDMALRIYYKGKLNCTGNLPRKLAYSLSANAFATKVILKVNGLDNRTMQTVVAGTRVFTAGGEVPSQNIGRNTTTGELTVIGLTPQQQYHFSTAMAEGAEPEKNAAVTTTTEAAAQPENGAMENWSSIKHDKHTYFFVGADYFEYFPNSVTSNSYWASRNPMTTYYEGKSTLPYTVFSGTRPTDAGVSGKAAEIMTIGWGEGNTYVPSGSIVKHRTAGMLFMGDYSYDGSEHPSYGRPFTSRPASLSFDYKFAPVSGESFMAYVVIENRNGGKVTELARGELVSGEAVSNYRTATVTLNYTNLSLKATHAYIVFISSTAQKPSTSPVKHNGEEVHRGNLLTVDNIKFNY